MIILDYDPFAHESRVYSIDKAGRRTQDVVSSNITQLGRELVMAAYLNEDYEVRLNAPPAIFSAVSLDIANEERNLYSTNKINVERI